MALPSRKGLFLILSKNEKDEKNFVYHHYF